MKRYICLLAILTAIAALLCGCSLARSDMDASAASRDRLIGVYITTEYIDLFDLEGYIGANASALSGGSIGEADAAQYNGRLYAELVDERYVFPGVDGFAFFMATTEHEYGTSYSNYTDEGVCGCKIAVNTNDNEDSSEEALELECTIYGLTGNGGRHVIYQSRVPNRRRRGLPHFWAWHIHLRRWRGRISFAKADRQHHLYRFRRQRRNKLRKRERALRCGRTAFRLYAHRDGCRQPRNFPP